MTREMTKTLEVEGTQSVEFVERADTFSITSGGRNGTPVVTLQQVTAGDMIKVTCVFNVRTDSGGGFYYEIQGIEGTSKLSSGVGVVTSPAWATASRIDFFKATSSGDSSFEVNFVKGDLNGQGTANSFMLIAENFGG